MHRAELLLNATDLNAARRYGTAEVRGAGRTDAHSRYPSP